MNIIADKKRFFIALCCLIFWELTTLKVPAFIFRPQSHLYNKIIQLAALRWPGPVYLRVGYVVEPRFSARTISPISIILASLIKNGWSLRKCYFFFLVAIKTYEISAYLKPHFYEKWKQFWNADRFFPNFSKYKSVLSIA